eukprot:scaffold182066_cov35-Tisochrysis_lutea.AAC.1
MPRAAQRPAASGLRASSADRTPVVELCWSATPSSVSIAKEMASRLAPPAATRVLPGGRRISTAAVNPTPSVVSQRDRRSSSSATAHAPYATGAHRRRAAPLARQPARPAPESADSRSSSATHAQTAALSSARSTEPSVGWSSSTAPRSAHRTRASAAWANSRRAAPTSRIERAVSRGVFAGVPLGLPDFLNDDHVLRT